MTKMKKIVCEQCGSVGKMRKGLCDRCYTRLGRPTKECVRCHRNRTIKNNTPDGPICGTCYNRAYVPPMRVCAVCGETRIILSHDTNGNPICDGCYRKSYAAPFAQCSQCASIDHVQQRDDKGNAICRKCYMKTYKYPCEQCAECGKILAVYRRHGSHPLCCDCGSLKQKCAICGEIARVYIRTQNGESICSKCYMQTYKRTIIKCDFCHEQRPKHTMIEGLQSCDRCYRTWRYKNDENFRLVSLLRSRLRKAIKGLVNAPKTVNGVCIDFKAIVKFLGPRPDDEETWHVDHIAPLCSFDLSDPEQLRKAFAPENHQWLKAKDNLSKGGRIPICRQQL